LQLPQVQLQVTNIKLGVLDLNELCFENCPAAFYCIQTHAICTNTQLSRSVSS